MWAKTIALLLAGFIGVVVIVACTEPSRQLSAIESEVAAGSEVALGSKAALGKALFNDISLSRDGTQACASCHDSSRGFVDARPNASSHRAGEPGAVSLGQDGLSIGDINTPSIAYLGFAPNFHFDESDPEEALFKGGFFLNGRAGSLHEQAKGPFLNPIEMQTTVAEVVVKVRAGYRQELESIYGKDVFTSDEAAFDAISDVIVAYERSPEFSSFDSKFDRVLAGVEEFSEQEQRGLELFKAEDKGNCAACHLVPEAGMPKGERLFTDFTYDNLGVPANVVARQLNGLGEKHQDAGLLANPGVSDEALKGAFRVVSLRNIAITGPYMHNGVFRDLATVVHFYNNRDVAGAINPETLKPWRKAEVPETMNTEELGDLGLSDSEVDDIVVFMKTLTDARYEPLLGAK